MATFKGTARADSFIGGPGPDHLIGLAGADKLTGGRGKDVLDGGDGDDRLWGSGGDDRLLGGLGRDNLQGDAGRDLLYGGDGGDTLFGGFELEADSLYGQGGNDFLSVYQSDRGFGGSGNDHISVLGLSVLAVGEAGDDTLSVRTGGEGITLRGGPGADTFDIFAPREAPLSLTVADFTAGEDTLQVGTADGQGGFVELAQHVASFDVDQDGQLGVGDGFGQAQADGDSYVFRQDAGGAATGLELHLGSVTLWLPGVDEL